MTVRPSVLIVEDNNQKRDLLSRRLAAYGYAVAVASNGNDALPRLTPAGCDLVLLGTEMPGRNRLDLLTHVRATWSSVELPVLVLSLRPDGPEVLEALRLGANDCVTEPIESPVAFARISAHIAHKQANEALRAAEDRLALLSRKADDGLPGRRTFLDQIDDALKGHDRSPGAAFAVLVLELDRVRMVSGSLGSEMADRLLDRVGQRLQETLRPGAPADDHAFTLARMGGHEFAVLLDHIAGARDAVLAAVRLRQALERPFDIDGHQLFTSASVGITVSTFGYQHSEDVLRDATTALHRAQLDPTSGCELFDPAMRDQAVARLRLETDLRQGIDENAFVVHYQPIVELESGRIVGFEALVRWNHPRRGLLGPDDFLDVAEDTGMIVAIGRQVLIESCRQMAAWQREFGDRAPKSICVNVSTRQFADTDLAGEVEAILTETGLSASRLKLEITESAFIADVPAAQVTLKRLQALGVEWSLDDFGTGYSSLNHLHQLQVNTVKIDRSFVSRLGVEDAGTEMVRIIVALAHNLSMNVVAEGVESAEQHARLRSLGCEFTQGFHFSAPVDVRAAEKLIAAQPWAEDAPACGAG